MLQLKENDKDYRAFSTITRRRIATAAETTPAPQNSGARQTITRAILAAIVAFYCVIPDLAQARDRRIEESLNDDSTAPVEAYIDETGKPRFITGQFPYALALSKEAVAKQFLQDHRVEFGIPALHTFETTRVFADKGMNSTVVRVSQYVDGIPIFASDVAINISAENEVRVVSGQFYSTNFDTKTPKISKETAINNANSTLGISQLVGVPSAELVGLAGGNDGLLSWHVIFNTLASDGAFGEWHYFIDARSGELLHKYDGAFHILNRDTYDANNTVDVTQSILEIAEGGASSDKVAQETHDNVGIVYDYFLNHHGRDGWDDLGGKIESYVHWGADLNNAYYLKYYNGRINQPAIVFGDGDRKNSGLLPFGTALDVVAHEYTHGIVNHTANLAFFEQSRELNESFADVFAMFVDADDFLMGEELYRDNDWDKGLEPFSFRSISNPSVAQKNHMSQYQIRDGHHTYFPHFNAGITNKAFFKILSKIGRSDTEKVYYRALTTYMTSSTDFLGARLALEQAATDLFGPVSEQLAAVRSGFDAVGISPPPSDFVGVFIVDPNTYPPADSSGRIGKTFTHPGASAMKLDVSVWKNPGRPVYIKNGSGVVIYTYNGRFRDKSGFTTGPVLGDTITIEFYPDPAQPPAPRLTQRLNGSPIIAGYFYDDNLDSTPPVISDEKVAFVDPFTATISWRTDEPADGNIQWGLASAYDNTTPLQPHKSINHEVILDRLMPETTYHFLAESADSAGNAANASDVTFTTPVATDVVTINSVKWPEFGSLKLSAASTDLSATLTVIFKFPAFPDGATIGEMFPDGKGKGVHNLITRTWLNRRDTDTEIMVRSSSGGFASHIFPAVLP